MVVMFAYSLSWGGGMWYFYHSPSGLRGLCIHLELPMILLSYCSVGDTLVADFLLWSSFVASAL